MQGRPLHGMIGGIDADGGSDVDEFADGRAPDGAVLHDIGIVAHLDLLDAATLRNFGVAADRAVGDAGGFVDDGLKADLHTHAAAFRGENCETSRMRSATASRTSSS